MADWTSDEISFLQANTHLSTAQIGFELTNRSKDAINSARKRYQAPYKTDHMGREAVRDLLNSENIPEIVRDFFYGGGWQHDYGETLEFEAGHNWIITGDYQLPAGAYDYIALMCAYAKKYLPEGDRNLIIAGDLFNVDALSKWKNIVKPPDWQTEVEVFTYTIYLIFEVFDTVVFMPGNHEHRWLKHMKGEVTFREMMIGALKDVPNVPKVIFTPVDRLIIKNANPHAKADWLVCHMGNYALNVLKAADEMTWAHEKNIIGHHEHHWGGAINRYGRYEIINNGTMCNPDGLVYKAIVTDKHASFELGFVHLLPTGYAKRFGSSLVTDWDELLPMEEKED